MGFEPTRAEHIGLAVQRLNHSATSSLMKESALRQNFKLEYNNSVEISEIQFKSKFLKCLKRTKISLNYDFELFDLIFNAIRVEFSRFLRFYRYFDDFCYYLALLWTKVL